MQDSFWWDLPEALVLVAHGALIPTCFLSFVYIASGFGSQRLILLSWAGCAIGAIGFQMNFLIQKKRTREYGNSRNSESLRTTFFQYKLNTWMSVLLKSVCLGVSLGLSTALATSEDPLGVAWAVFTVSTIISITTFVAILVEIRRLYGPIRRDEQIYLDVERDQQGPLYLDDEETLYTDEQE
ncbi:hypothetical protein BX600DRAFT_439825 [Xylariales sp. PMI_506]|nr:hypothetical protein BX600DRAFT_439825 [Xylariales sp. PMI_506]